MLSEIYLLYENKDDILMFSESYLFNNWNLNKKKYHLLKSTIMKMFIKMIQIKKMKLKKSMMSVYHASN